MKTRLILIVIASAALLSFGASRIASHKSEKATLAQNQEAPIGGFAAEDK